MLQKAMFYILKGRLLHISRIRPIVDNFINN